MSNEQNNTAGSKHTKKTSATLARTGDNEPIFVLRAQDLSAPATVRDWLTRNPQITHEKRRDAEEVIREMEAWPNKKQVD